MITHQLDLLDNAVDSLVEALNKYEQGGNGEPKAYKFAVLHMSHFVELIFKYHVAQKHPLLIYKDAFSPKLDRTRTITLWDAINFINNESADTLIKDFRTDLEWLKRLRNDIEHYKFLMDVPEVRTTLGRLFRSMVEFIDEQTEIDIRSHIPQSAIDTFTILSDEYESQLRAAIQEAKAIESANMPDFTSGDTSVVLLECPEYGNRTLVLNAESSTGFECTFCGNKHSDEIPDYCSTCGTEAMVGELEHWRDEDGTVESRCYYCSGRYHLDKDN